MRISALAAALLCSVTALPAVAGDAWDSVRAQLFGDRPLLDGSDLIALDAPYRTADDARTQIAAMVHAPKGQWLGKVTLVLDENPMPVSAVFALDAPQQGFFFDVTMRVNGPTGLHVIAETTDGRLWVTEGFVKTSGQGACAAPPGSDPDAALATLGDMVLEVGRLGAQPGTAGGLEAALTGRLSKLDVDISHPSHSGMQMDQISLLYIPMRYVETVEIDLDGGGYVDVTGSISLSENPRIGLSVPRAARSVDVTMTDTRGTRTKQHKELAGF
ncbi:quinoprotein dehydrogenase-associated SoxYZ-like carrier [Meridianimarinicoccus roseus]|jgi:sulfur-oxidizing protein SoxY|uniref:Quinoprotein dehydrogenase-associated SoxYZ-like carrier n=1 Tax=Meridianimarinicoccus roseus TaxID=2072018 RepID=A0A2V2LPX0_9RHOB|nr:quinoprotein dehydrogenase-associated SoxYZ-like carrier [Meridianimarinicoccus roseus]PWR04269.1 quinoprotein dehydrogenase-associated SoxYZ-like carrier [Meridianimarinicoccus roseus]